MNPHHTVCITCVTAHTRVTTRGVLRCHYLSLSLCSDRRLEVGVVYTEVMLHQVKVGETEQSETEATALERKTIYSKDIQRNIFQLKGIM